MRITGQNLPANAEKESFMISKEKSDNTPPKNSIIIAGTKYRGRNPRYLYNPLQIRETANTTEKSGQSCTNENGSIAELLNKIKIAPILKKKPVNTTPDLT